MKAENKPDGKTDASPANEEAAKFGPETDSHEDRGYPPPRCQHDWGINGCKKCGQPAMPRG